MIGVNQESTGSIHDLFKMASNQSGVEAQQYLSSTGDAQKKKQENAREALKNERNKLKQSLMK